MKAQSSAAFSVVTKPEKSGVKKAIRKKPCTFIKNKTFIRHKKHFVSFAHQTIKANNFGVHNSANFSVNNATDFNINNLKPAANQNDISPKIDLKPASSSKVTFSHPASEYKKTLPKGQSFLYSYRMHWLRHALLDVDTHNAATKGSSGAVGVSIGADGRGGTASATAQNNAVDTVWDVSIFRGITQAEIDLFIIFINSL